MHGVMSRFLVILMCLLFQACQARPDMKIDPNARDADKPNVLRNLILNGHVNPDLDVEAGRTGKPRIPPAFNRGISLNDLEHVDEFTDPWARAYFTLCVPAETIEITYIQVYDREDLLKQYNNESIVKIACQSGYIPFAFDPGNGASYIVNPRTGRVFYIILGTMGTDGIYGNFPDGRRGSYIKTDRFDDGLMEQASYGVWENLYAFWDGDFNARIEDAMYGH